MKIIVLLIGFGVIIGLVFALNYIEGDNANTITALFAVIIGGLITGLTQYWTTTTTIHQQLRVAALDRRMQAHQEAYTLWRKLLFSDRSQPEYYELIQECQEWWENNCIYLSAEARVAFQRAYLSASDNYLFLKSNEDSRLLKDSWKDVAVAGKIIVAGVGLPPIGESETKHISKK